MGQKMVAAFPNGNSFCWELRDWTKTRGVLADELKSAVDAVGPGVKKVKEFLKK